MQPQLTTSPSSTTVVGSSSSTTAISTSTITISTASTSTSASSVWSFSYSLNYYQFPQGQTSDLNVSENLTNVSNQTQTISGAENEITQYSVFNSNNKSLACSFYDGDYIGDNFSVAPGSSLDFQGTMPSYSYNARANACSGVADLLPGTYILEVFSAWGNGTGTDITPLPVSANATITITPNSQSSTIFSSTSYSYTT